LLSRKEERKRGREKWRDSWGQLCEGEIERAWNMNKKKKIIIEKKRQKMNRKLKRKHNRQVKKENENSREIPEKSGRGLV
jgi:hypothetical protein